MDAGNGFSKAREKFVPGGFSQVNVSDDTRLSAVEIDTTRENLGAITHNLGKNYALSKTELEVLHSAWNILCDLYMVTKWPDYNEKLLTGGIKKSGR